MATSPRATPMGIRTATSVPSRMIPRSTDRVAFPDASDVPNPPNQRKAPLMSRRQNVGWMYKYAHLKTQQARGRAAEYACSWCARPARQWALVGTGTLVDGLPYSDDPADYQPMCVRCHNRMDAGWLDADTCPRGHDGQSGRTLPGCGKCANDNAARFDARRTPEQQAVRAQARREHFERNRDAINARRRARRNGLDPTA